MFDWRIWGLSCIALLSLGLNLWNNDFPLGYHSDETKKVQFILDGQQDFFHPILMLQIVRLANAIGAYSDPQRIAELGRCLIALSGTMTLLIFFMIARRLLVSPFDLLATLSLACSPILVVHSHYLKEDVLLALFTMCSFAAAIELQRNPSWRTGILLGVSMGLAVSLVVTFLLFPAVLMISGKISLVERKRSVPPVTTFFAKLTSKHAGLIWGTSIVVAVATVIGISMLKVENSFIDYFKKSTEIYQGMTVIDQKLGGTNYDTCKI